MSEASKELNRDIKEHKGILSRLETNEKRFKDLEIVRNRLETRLQAAQEAHAIVEQALIDVDEEMEAKLIANPGGAEELKLRLNITELESQVQTMEEELTALQAKFQEEGFDKIDEVIKYLEDNRESKVAAGESTSGEDRALAEMDERQSEAEQILSRAQQLIELIDGSKLEIQNLSKGLEATQRHDEVARAEVKQLATLNDKRSADLTAARENLTQVKQEYDSAKSEVDRVKAAVETDERTLAELSEAIQGHQQKVTGLESTLTRQKEALAPISQKLERNFNDMLREMTMLQNSVQ
jgi:chromosome segregation ATPase